MVCPQFGVVNTDGEPFHASIRLLGGLLLLPQETVLGAEFRTAELEEALYVPLRDFALPPKTTILFRFCRWVSGVTTPTCPGWPLLSCQIGRKFVYHPEKRVEVKP
jgi:hypothetical protein